MHPRTLPPSFTNIRVPLIRDVCLKTPSTSLCSLSRSFQCVQLSTKSRSDRMNNDEYREARKRAYESAILSLKRKNQMNRPLDFAFWGSDSTFIRNMPESMSKDILSITREAQDSERVVENNRNNESEKWTPYNFRVPAHRLEQQLEKSKSLLKTHFDPLQDLNPGRQLSLFDDDIRETPEQKQEIREKEENEDQNAQTAIQRILAADMSSSKQQTKRYIDLCIEKFGRHNTDQELSDRNKFRVGRDTGSSEVQIAILTVKILKIAQMVSGKGRHDKSNKRELQMMIHKRQKLLNYLKRKEMGGPRYQNLIQELGLE